MGGWGGGEIGVVGCVLLFGSEVPVPGVKRGKSLSMPRVLFFCFFNY